MKESEKQSTSHNNLSSAQNGNYLAAPSPARALCNIAAQNQPQNAAQLLAPNVESQGSATLVGETHIKHLNIEVGFQC